MLSTAVMDAWHTLVPQCGEKSGPLSPALVILTIVTGTVDAVSYLSLGHVFVANMTGNVVFLGFALAGAGGFSIGTSLTALGAFAVGSLLGGRLGATGPRHRGRLLAAAVSAQGLLVLVAIIVSAAVRGGSAATQYALISLLGIAMGLQNATVRRLNVADLTTTVLTMTLSGIFADATWLAGPGARLGRRSVSVAAMFLGALISALILLHSSRTAALLVPLLLLVALSAGMAARWRSRAAWTSV